MNPATFLKCSFLVAGLFLASGGVARAQRPAHYFPVRPPLSPYLYYSAVNTTGLPNYYTYIRTTQQFQSFLDRSRAQIGRIENRLRLGDTGGVSDEAARQVELRETTGYGSPAVPGTFMEYSHYYSIRPGRR
jgi:hypothetical protein